MPQGTAAKILLASTARERSAAIAQLRDYLDRSGLGVGDFARRIDYSYQALNFFLNDKYHHIGGDDSNIRRAIAHYMDAHPVAPPTEVTGDLYETANLKLIRSTFQALLPRPAIYLVDGPPGSQKTFGLTNEIARLNLAEIPKNGHGRRAYYVYARQNIKPLDLMRRVARACGSPQHQSIDRMLTNIEHDFRTRRVLLVIDEAQHLDLECLEVLRELYDRPPHFSILLAGSHDLRKKFDKFSATMEQWNSRIIAKRKLPGITEDEARAIIDREAGDWLRTVARESAERKVRKLIEQATSKDAFDNNRPYINVRTLTNSLFQNRADADGQKEAIA